MNAEILQQKFKLPVSIAKLKLASALIIQFSGKRMNINS